MIKILRDDTEPWSWSMAAGYALMSMWLRKDKNIIKKYTYWTKHFYGASSNMDNSVFYTSPIHKFKWKCLSHTYQDIFECFSHSLEVQRIKHNTMMQGSDHSWLCLVSLRHRPQRVFVQEVFQPSQPPSELHCWHLSPGYQSNSWHF